MAVRDRGQRLDLDVDRLQGILRQSRALGQDQRDRLADIAHLAMGDDWLPERLEIRQGLQPHRNVRHLAAEVRRRDHAMHARQHPRPRRVDRPDAAMGDRAAQDRRMQHAFAREIVDILPAAAQKAEILQAFDRAADERVDRPHARSCSRL